MAMQNAFPTFSPSHPPVLAHSPTRRCTGAPLPITVYRRGTTAAPPSARRPGPAPPAVHRLRSATPRFRRPLQIGDIAAALPQPPVAPRFQKGRSPVQKGAYRRHRPGADHMETPPVFALPPQLLHPFVDHGHGAQPQLGDGRLQEQGLFADGVHHQHLEVGPHDGDGNGRKPSAAPDVQQPGSLGRRRQGKGNEGWQQVVGPEVLDVAAGDQVDALVPVPQHPGVMRQGLPLGGSDVRK